MRKKIVAGNWKMNLLPSETKGLLEEINAGLGDLKAHQHVICCTPFTHLASANEYLKSNASKIKLGAQNCNDKTSGAYTGEISTAMLKDSGVSAVIIGHSERRQYFAESNEFLKSKVDALIDANMLIIFCCGEPLEIREANTQNDFVAIQLKESLFHLNAGHLKEHVVIAYEPIWAIGTGKTASSDQAQDMHAHIRSLLAAHYGTDVAEDISILYGGSCNAANAVELFSQPDVDGGLIGGAALKADSFLPIIHAMN